MKGIFGGITGILGTIGNVFIKSFLFIFLGRSYESSYFVDRFVGVFITTIVSAIIVYFNGIKNLEAFGIIMGTTFFLFILVFFEMALIEDEENNNKRKDKD
jgi:choline-glycine betaine transporter